MSWKFDMSERVEGNCFVYIQGNEVNIDKYYELVRLSKDDKIILYPERGNTMVDNICYRPYVKSVVTENPWIISTYPRDNVWMIIDGEWRNPNDQTYGCSVNKIMCIILKYHNTIPMLVVSGIKGIDEFREKIKLNK